MINKIIEIWDKVLILEVILNISGLFYIYYCLIYINMFLEIESQSEFIKLVRFPSLYYFIGNTCIILYIIKLFKKKNYYNLSLIKKWYVIFTVWSLLLITLEMVYQHENRTYVSLKVLFDNFFINVIYRIILCFLLILYLNKSKKIQKLFSSNNIEELKET
jgi:hypothetical protein